MPDICLNPDHCLVQLYFIFPRVIPISVAQRSDTELIMKVSELKRQKHSKLQHCPVDISPQMSEKQTPLSDVDPETHSHQANQRNLLPDQWPPPEPLREFAMRHKRKASPPVAQLLPSGALPFATWPPSSKASQLGKGVWARKHNAVRCPFGQTMEGTVLVQRIFLEDVEVAKRSGCNASSQRSQLLAASDVTISPHLERRTWPANSGTC